MFHRTRLGRLALLLTACLAAGCSGRPYVVSPTDSDGSSSDGAAQPPADDPPMQPAGVWAYPLTVSPDGKELLDGNGFPVFINAESAWHLNMRLTPAEVDLYLDDRAAKGFNAVLVTALVGIDYHGTHENYAGENPFTSMSPVSFASPNETYWQHVDWVIERARQEGLLVLFAPSYLGYQCGGQGFCSAMKAAGTSVMTQYGEWIGTRYARQENILWVHGGDADANAHGAMAEVNALANAIKNVDEDHLHTAHCNRQNGARECYDQPWLDVDNTYSECVNVARETRDTYERTPPKPHFFIEGWYENEHGTSDQCLRAQSYYSVLGGSLGHVYGIGEVWGFFDGWELVLDTAGSDSMTHMRNLFESRNWSTLVPDFDHTVVTSGYGNIDDASYVASAVTTDGDTLIAYLPSQTTITIDLDVLSGASKDAYWYDPSDGARQTAGSHTGGLETFTPPAAGDWVLVIDDADAGYPPPGS